MAIDKETADQYFVEGNHTDHIIWNAFDDPCRESAIAEAKRRLQLELKRLDSNCDGLIEDSELNDEYLPRHDYAVFEQALHILIHSNTPNGELSGPKWIGQRVADKMEKGVDGFMICKEAGFYMNWKPKEISISRG